MWFYVFSFTGDPTWNVDVFALFNRCFCGRAEIFFFVPIQLKFFEVITAVLFNFGDLTFPQSYSYRSSSVSDKQCYIWWGFFFACFEYIFSSSPLNKTLAFSPTDWPFGALCRICVISLWSVFDAFHWNAKFLAYSILEYLFILYSTASPYLIFCGLMLVREVGSLASSLRFSSSFFSAVKQITRVSSWFSWMVKSKYLADFGLAGICISETEWMYPWTSL